MQKRYQINEEQIAEIERIRKKNKNKNIEKRLKALLLHAEGKKRSEVAEKTGFAKSYVSELVSKYCNKGIHAIVENKYIGNHRNISFAEEAELLEKFKKMAEDGQPVSISEIKKAYEEAIGHSLEKSSGQIYRVLKRHGWQKGTLLSKYSDKTQTKVLQSAEKA